MEKYKISIHLDTNPDNPFTDWDCNYPLMFSSRGNTSDYIDYSDGQIVEYLVNHFENNKEVIAYNFDIDTADELIEYLEESINNCVSYCEKLDILHYANVSTGYSQGDWAMVLIVPTPTNATHLGYDLKDITPSQLRETFDLFTHWIWGDVYGYRIHKYIPFKKVYEDGVEEYDGEWVLEDSCYGFYGDDPVKNGMVDHIDYKAYGWTKEELIEKIKTAELMY